LLSGRQSLEPSTATERDVFSGDLTASWNILDVTSERLKARLALLESDVQQAFDDSRALYTARKTAPMAALTYQRELNDVRGQSQRLSRDLKLAKMELAALMGLSPDQSFTLQMPRRSRELEFARCVFYENAKAQG